MKVQDLYKMPRRKREVSLIGNNHGQALIHKMGNASADELDIAILESIEMDYPKKRWGRK